MPRPSNYSGGSSSSRKSSSGRRPGARPSASSRSGIGRLLLGVLLGCLFTIAAATAYFYLGKPPVAVSDKPALWEHFTTTVPLHSRLQAESKQPPFSAGEDGFEAAAKIYRTQCAQCHGNPGHEAALGRAMLPHAQQFFGRDSKATAARPVGELFWVTTNGVRRSGMPAYARTLSNTDLWNLALLLHAADGDLPDPVRTLLAPTIPATLPTQSQATR